MNNIFKMFLMALLMLSLAFVACEEGDGDGDGGDSGDSDTEDSTTTTTLDPADAMSIGKIVLTGLPATWKGEKVFLGGNGLKGWPMANWSPDAEFVYSGEVLEIEVTPADMSTDGVTVITPAVYDYGTTITVNAMMYQRDKWDGDDINKFPADCSQFGGSALEFTGGVAKIPYDVGTWGAFADNFPSTIPGASAVLDSDGKFAPWKWDDKIQAHDDANLDRPPFDDMEFKLINAGGVTEADNGKLNTANITVGPIVFKKKYDIIGKGKVIKTDKDGGWDWSVVEVTP